MQQALGLFDGYGIELEYMIVAQNSLNVLPICDKLMQQLAGNEVNEYSFGKIAVSNELVLHVLEFKCNGPSPSLHGLAAEFHKHIVNINQLLAKYDAMLLPTGAHPWMDPESETKIWPHEYNDIYKSYHRIFNCSGHGWSNLQSTHLNLPFANDHEFAKLHTAIRLLLPIIPALSASTPVLDNKPTGMLDTRLKYYCINQQAVPSIAGKIIPEAVFSQAEYKNTILQKIYRDIAPYDTLNVLQEEWLNSRAAIAKFAINAIEIRILDVQECPAADLAILALITEVLKALVTERWISFKEQAGWHEDELAAIFFSTIAHGQSALLSNLAYLRIFGIPTALTVKELWQQLYHLFKPQLGEHATALEHILFQGNLAERIMQAYRQQIALPVIYRDLAQCLQNNQLYQSN